MIFLNSVDLKCNPWNYLDLFYRNPPVSQCYSSFNQENKYSWVEPRQHDRSERTGQNVAISPILHNAVFETETDIAFVGQVIKTIAKKISNIGQYTFWTIILLFLIWPQVKKKNATCTNMDDRPCELKSDNVQYSECNASTPFVWWGSVTMLFTSMKKIFKELNYISSFEWYLFGWTLLVTWDQRLVTYLRLAKHWLGLTSANNKPCFTPLLPSVVLLIHNYNALLFTVCGLRTVQLKVRLITKLLYYTNN